MSEWIWVAEALKIHHITKPTLYKYIGLWKVFTKVEKNRLFIDRQGLKEYINNKKKYWWKAVNTYIKWLFDDNNEKPEKEPEKQVIEDENNSQNRLSMAVVWSLMKKNDDLLWIIIQSKDWVIEEKNLIIEEKDLIIEEKDLIIEEKNKKITRLSSIMWLLIWLFISLSIAFIYFVIL